jgi:hypothetical protein
LLGSQGLERSAGLTSREGVAGERSEAETEGFIRVIGEPAGHLGSIPWRAIDDRSKIPPISW